MSRKHVATLSADPADRSRDADRPPANRLLAALSFEDRRRLLPELTTVPIRVRQLLHTRGEPLREVYFPNGGVVSITTRLRDGTTIEVATVGDEGMVGIEACFSDQPVATADALIQVPDTSAESMRVEDFRREFRRQKGLGDLIGRYTQVVISQLRQSAACNALHHVQ